MKTKLGRRAMPSEDNPKSSTGHRRLLPGGGDLVDEAVVERFPCVEITSAPHVLGDLLGGSAGALGQAPVELPEELLLLAALRGDLLRSTGKLRRRLGKVESRMRRGSAVMGGRDQADGRAADLTPAKDVQGRGQVGGVDQDEGRPK